MDIKTNKLDDAGDRVSIIEMAAYNAPEAVEETAEGYVTYGQNNSYFGYIQECYNGSATNRAIINTISLMIYGKGLTATNAEENPKQMAEIDKIFKKKELRLIAAGLKKDGQVAMQVAWNEKHTKVIGVKFQPIATVAKGEMTEDGAIKSYFLSRDFNDTNKYEPKEFPAFGTSTKRIELLYVGLPTGTVDYYSNVDYQAGLNYCTLEEEMANYHLNTVINGFSPTILINFNDGIPTIKKQMEMEAKVLSKWTGTTKQKIITSFNENGDEKPTIDTIDIPDAHSKYEFLSNESTQKLLISHRVTSPMLMGIKDNSGLGNNADELKTATQLFNATVIRPYQDIILEEIIEPIAEKNKINLDLYFDTLQPIEFTEDGMEETQDKEEVEKETGVEMMQLSEDDLADLLKNFGQPLDSLDDYEIIKAENAAGEAPEMDYEKIMNESIEMSSIQKSEQDKPFYKVRYRYTKGTSKNAVGETRQFCSTMLNLAAQGVVYRKEDIKQMSDKGINGQFAHSGGKYDIFLYAGGVNCHHIWERVIFKKKALPNGKPYGGHATQNTKVVSGGQAKKAGYNAPANPKDVTIAEIDKPNKGRYNG